MSLISFSREDKIRAGILKPRRRIEEKPVVKVYWRIQEVATELGVNTSAIRFWESEFHINRDRRGSRGDRMYTRTEIERLKLIVRAIEYLQISAAKRLLNQGVARLEKVVKEIEEGTANG